MFSVALLFFQLQVSQGTADAGGELGARKFYQLKEDTLELSSCPALFHKNLPMNMTREELFLQAILANSANGPLSPQKLDQFIQLSILAVQRMNYYRMEATAKIHAQSESAQEKPSTDAPLAKDYVAQPAPKQKEVIPEAVEEIVEEMDEAETLVEEAELTSTYEEMIQRIDELPKEFKSEDLAEIGQDIKKYSETRDRAGNLMLNPDQVQSLRLLYSTKQMALKARIRKASQQSPPPPPSRQEGPPPFTDEDMPIYSFH